MSRTIESAGQFLPFFSSTSIPCVSRFSHILSLFPNLVVFLHVLLYNLTKMTPKMAIREKSFRETDQVGEPQHCDSLLPLFIYPTFPPSLRRFHYVCAALSLAFRTVFSLHSSFQGRRGLGERNRKWMHHADDKNDEDDGRPMTILKTMLSKCLRKTMKTYMHT